tara:strand:+ start:76 stop:285 length:210 start_codon:yes stop_codon:yes gene_type:complete
MNDQEIIEALSAIAYEMTTLEPRLSEPFSSNVKVCGELARQVRTELESRGESPITARLKRDIASDINGE